MKKYIKAHSNYYENLPEEFTVGEPKTVDDAKARRSAKLNSKIQRKKDEHGAKQRALQEEYAQLKEQFFDIDRQIQLLVPDAVDILSTAKEIYDVEGGYSKVSKYMEEEFCYCDNVGTIDEQFGLSYDPFAEYITFYDVYIYPDGKFKYRRAKYSYSTTSSYFDDVKEVGYSNENLRGWINWYEKFLEAFQEFSDKFYAFIDEYADDAE